MKLTPHDLYIVELLKLTMQLAIDEPPVYSWVSLSLSTRALKCASNMLASHLPGLRPLFSVSFMKVYNFYKLVHGSSNAEPVQRHLGCPSALRAHGEALFTFARHAKYFFPPGSAQQIVDLLMTIVNEGDATSTTTLEAQMLLSLFYPGDENDDPLPRLDSFVKAWDRIDSSAEWDTCWFTLVRRLAKNHLSRENFQPHLSKIFGRVHSALKVSARGTPERKPLLAGFQYLGPSRVQTICGKLVVNILSVDNAMDRLEYLLASVRTHLHPSNAGPQVCFGFFIPPSIYLFI